MRAYLALRATLRGSFGTVHSQQELELCLVFTVRNSPYSLSFKKFHQTVFFHQIGLIQLYSITQNRHEKHIFIIRCI